MVLPVGGMVVGTNVVPVVGRVVVVDGSVMMVEGGMVLPVSMVVVVGQGPMPPPGRGQSKWNVVVVVPGAEVTLVVVPEPLHP